MLAPAMPVTVNEKGKTVHEHRACVTAVIEEHIKDNREDLVNALLMTAAVARLIPRPEVANTPEAKKALDVEWEKLRSKGTWDESRVKECKTVIAEAKAKGEKAHIARIFEACYLKGSELAVGDPSRKYKGRTVFEGNRVVDENYEQAMFAELGSSPASMEAGKIVDLYGSQPGFGKHAKQAYTQALFEGITTWVRLPRDRWPKEWIGKYNDPLSPLILALYGHIDSGGLWENHFETGLRKNKWRPLLKGIWQSVFFHDELKLLLVVYVDDLKLAGPTANLAKGWKNIESAIEIDTPESLGRYFGCEHVEQNLVTLTKEHHPFAHVFEKQSASPAVPHRTEDYWEHFFEEKIWVRHHLYARRKRYAPENFEGLLDLRVTCVAKGNTYEYLEDSWKAQADVKEKNWWTGCTVFSYADQVGGHAAAAAMRNKTAAKKQSKKSKFKELIDMDHPKDGCMKKPVNIVHYDMADFLDSCVESYCELAKTSRATLKNVSTPFHEMRTALPRESEKEPTGKLQPIASRVLMKILFAARMARYDLLRATQSLASRVTKWSKDCDEGLHRLVAYINSTLNHRMSCFIRDSLLDCRLWVFRDADYAGEFDSRSTTGCVAVIVGPNTYYPINAFSKKQTSTAMSSTEAEVVAANHSVRAQGLPTLSLMSVLWELLDAPKEKQPAGGNAKPIPFPGRDNSGQGGNPVLVYVDPELDEIRYGGF